MTKIERKINVLDDKGYVMIHDVLGTDLTVANAARVSYAKKSATLTDGDKRLIDFLAREGHTSPFRHVIAQFEFNAPLMVARQHWKYVVGSSMLEATGDNMDAWNESSRRYVTEEPTFYVPQPYEWRSAPENSKQGSGDIVRFEIGESATSALIQHVDVCIKLYEDAISSGICAEQARLFLPAYGMYVKYYWTASLQSVCHFLNQRLAHDSQVEIQMYAKAVLELIKPHFPISVEKLVSETSE
ncbi:FAD-dependent thymidylate synthase [Lysinibacillus capsici]|uniref:FAD-dependent thymidylate synthase n=1 Tax=Lysinibacillus capsici TaxID=2115968 RepID=UPI000E209C88|nr:FAD-dependent thymidylate synthase [Lysinibacillus capsici]RDV27759.1 thymidylate synthase (FAD) [Lysinibacillus capsici]